MKKLEAGKTPNEQRTTKKYTKSDGTVVKEEVVKNPETGEIKSHTIDGKPVEQNKLQITETNAPLLTAKFLELLIQNSVKQLQVLHRINMQLTEMNYYLQFLEPEDKRTPNNKGLVEYFAAKGYQITKKEA